MTTIADRRRRHSRRGESGQILVLLVLVLSTMAAAAFVSIAFGQALVRRQKAQMVVDAAALAGAAEQAKGLNTLARINEKQYNFLTAILHAQKVLAATGYTDSYSTTIGRVTFTNTGKDWAMDSWKAYDDQVFKLLNLAAEGVNRAYSPLVKPRLAAERVLDDNFDPWDGGLFANERSRPPDRGVVIPIHELGGVAQLVRLDEPGEYKAAVFRRYSPNPSYFGVWCPEFIGIIPNPPCIAAKKEMQAVYAGVNLYMLGKSLVDRASYHLGKFYQDGQTEVRFTYAMALEPAPPIAGVDFFHDLPPVIVAASAKPYQGHLGDTFEQSGIGKITGGVLNWTYNQQQGKEIAYTYKAKLVPMRTVDKQRLRFMGFDQGGVDDDDRFVAISH